MNKKNREAIAAARAKKAEEMKKQAEDRRIQEAVNVRTRIFRIGTALFYAAVSMTTSLPLAYAVPIWIIAIFSLVHVALDAIPRVRKFSMIRKLALSVLIMLLPFRLGAALIHKRYMQEKAAVLSGEIRARNPERWIRPVIEFGDSGVTYPWQSGDQPLHLLKDAGLSLETGANGIEISTVIRDRYGRRVMKIDRNHWTVDAPNSVDHNYTDNALEVLDGGGHVVFQVRMLPDRVQLRGEWHNEYGQGVQITECRAVAERQSGCVQVFGSNWPEQEKKIAFEPIFEYPSSEHWGELKKK